MNLNYEKIKVRYDGELENNQAKVVIEPLERGYSNIMAVPLRNVLLSSMPGVAVIGMRIDGVYTEFSKIAGSINDTVEVILNLKKMKFKMATDEMQTLKFKAKKEGYYTSNDIELPEGVELVTKDLPFIALDGSKEVEIELFIKKDRGYKESTTHKDFDDKEKYENVIKIDGMFTPIEKVAYETKGIVLEGNGNYEQLILTITTDGSMDALEAVNLAAKIVMFHFEFFKEMEAIEDEYELNKKEEIKEENRILDRNINVLELSVRSFNCLEKQGVETVRDLCELSLIGLKSIDHLGKKSLNEILEKLESLGLSLKNE